MEQTDKQKNIERFVRVFSIILAFFLISIVIVIKLNKPDFNIGWVIGLIFFIVIMTLSIFFVFTTYRKWEKLNELKDTKYPEPITYEQAKDIIREHLVSPEYADLFYGFTQHKFYNAGADGKSRILVVQLEPTPYERNPYRFIIMNLHYPKQLWSLVSQNKYNPGEIIRTVNQMSLSPQDEPDIEKTKVENILTGTTVSTEKKTHKKGKKKEDDKVEEDLK